eukprot:62448_1
MASDSDSPIFTPSLISIPNESHSVQSTRERLLNFYSIHNPEKLNDEVIINEVLRRYKGREVKLFADLHRKYNVDYAPNDLYWTYIERNGVPPKNANQLRAFALEIEHPIQWIDANYYIKHSSPMKAVLSPTVIPDIRTVYYTHKDTCYSVDVTEKEEYTVANLRNDVVMQIDQPANELGFYLDDEPVCDYEMDIIRYFEVYQRTEIGFEV